MDDDDDVENVDLDDSNPGEIQGEDEKSLVNNSSEKFKTFTKGKNFKNNNAESATMDKGDDDDVKAKKDDADNLNKTKRNDCVKIICDPADLDAGFVAPWSIVIRLDENITKKDLIEAVVKELDNVRNMFPNDKSKEQAYRRWVCRTLNIADAAFSSPDAMEVEMNAAADSLNMIKNNKAKVEVVNPKDSLSQDKSTSTDPKTDNANDNNDSGYINTGFFI